VIETEQQIEHVLDAAEVLLIDAYWRAANHLSVGQIYLLDNPLLRVPLEPEYVKPRLLGHWGTTPGLNFVYAHVNRAIRNWDLNAIYVGGALARGCLVRQSCCSLRLLSRQRRRRPIGQHRDAAAPARPVALLVTGASNPLGVHDWRRPRRA
jgi:hypothetical protein